MHWRECIEGFQGDKEEKRRERSRRAWKSRDWCSFLPIPTATGTRERHEESYSIVP